jgi:hypothetical protein
VNRAADSIGLVDVSDGDLDVWIGGNRLRFQVVQRGIVEGLPPGLSCRNGYCRCGRRLLEGRGRGHYGSTVVSGVTAEKR